MSQIPHICENKHTLTGATFVVTHLISDFIEDIPDALDKGDLVVGDESDKGLLLAAVQQEQNSDITLGSLGEVDTAGLEHEKP